MESKDLGSLLADFASAFQQHNRLLSLHFAGFGPAADTLLPFKLSGAEQLSHCYRYQLDCLAIDAALELKTLLGLPALITLLTGDGTRRPISGIVTSVQSLPSDGGFAAYRLIIEPGLALLGLRRTSRVFQAKTVPQIVQAILAEHQAANPILAQSFILELHLERPHPPRSYCVQHRETDLAFIERLLAEEGISYRFAFANNRELPSHTLVLFDDGYQLKGRRAAQATLPPHRWQRNGRHGIWLDKCTPTGARPSQPAQLRLQTGRFRFHYRRQLPRAWPSRQPGNAQPGRLSTANALLRRRLRRP
jgi:type VI secretion system secreted protein VgrG